MGIMGTLDTYYAGALGISVDMYKRMKDDPRLHKCLEVLDDISVRRWYTKDEQSVDSEVLGIPIPELIQQRSEALRDLTLRVKKNAAALEREYLKKRGQPTRTTKKTKESDISTFGPLITDQVIPRSTPASSVQRPETTKKPVETGTSKKRVEQNILTEAENQHKREKVLKHYHEMMSFRANSRKIIGAEIEFAPIDIDQTRFKVKLTRDQGFVDERPDCTAQAFGLTELIEIGVLLKGRAHTEAELAFIKKIHARLEKKFQMEVALGMRTASPFASASPTKRKASEEASGHIQKR